MYANDHGGQLPDSLDPLILDGSAPAQILFCPNVEEYDATGVIGGTPSQLLAQISAARMSYVYVGKGQTFRLGSNAVIAYELPDHHPVRKYKVTRPEDAPKGGHVLFADGHVGFVPEAALKQVIEQVSAGQNPPPAVASYTDGYVATTAPIP